MPKYMVQASYTAEGAKGLLKDGGTKRRAAARAAIESAGGKLEAFYFAFGGDDVYAIADLPDNAAAAASALTFAASGLIKVRTAVLLTPEEVDQASKKSISYTPPGR